MVTVSHLYKAVLLALAVGGVLTMTRGGHRNGQFYARRRNNGGRGGVRGNNRFGGSTNSTKEEKVSIREYVHAQRKQSVYCFQCAYSPDKDVYETIKAPTLVKDKQGRTRLVYRSRLMKVRKPGGWDKCVGPFGNSDADEYGISVKECQNTCYARLEKSGNIFRGCYEGAYGVDSHKYGCHEQQGSVWCFCEGQVCNNNEIEDTFNNPQGSTTPNPRDRRLSRKGYLNKRRPQIDIRKNS